MKTKQSLKYSIFFLFIEFFIFTNLCFASNDKILINEIAWMGTENSSSDEWIEFFNMSTSSIDIAGWSIYGADSNECLNFFNADGSVNTIILPNDYLLYGNSNDVLNDVQIDIWDTTIGLNNSNPGSIKLFNSSNCGNGTGIIIDEVNNTDEWIAGNKEEYKTMERVDISNWSSSQNIGGTPGSVNFVVNSEDDIEETSSEDYEIGDVPGDSNNKDDESEKVSKEVNIVNGYSSDNSVTFKKYEKNSVLINEVVSDPAKGESEWVEIILNIEDNIDLTGWGIFDASGSKTKIEGRLDDINKIAIIENINGNLNNKGDEIILKDGTGNIIDELRYGDKSLQNIPAPKNPNSLAREGDQFFITQNITKGKENIIEKNKEATDKLLKSDVVINEIFPNPSGDDRNNEFIELYNNSEHDIDLKGWILQNNIGQKYVFGLYDFGSVLIQDRDVDKKEYIIKSKKYLTIFRKDSYIALNNNYDNILLLSSSNVLLDKVKYSNAKEGWSYNSVLNLDYEKMVTSTRKFVLNSINKDDFVWSEIISPNKNNIIKTKNHAPIIDFSYPEEIFIRQNIMFDGSDTIDVDGDEIKFNWVFPNNINVSLPIVNHIFLEPGYFEVKLVADDGKDKSSLVKKIKVCDINGRNQKVDLVQNTKVNKELDKNEINLIKTKDVDRKINKNKSSADIKNSEQLIIKKPRQLNAKKNVNESDVVFIKLENVRKQAKIGDKIMTTGVVSVLPGVLGAQFFYISGSSGLQVYSYKKNFPEMAMGDYLEISGEILERYSEKYINIKNGGIRTLDYDKVISPEVLHCDQIIDEKIGMLVQISGKIIDRNGDKIYVDDGTGEALVIVKDSTNIDMKDIKEGESWKIVGIISRYNQFLRIMPRNMNDFEKIGVLTNKNNLLGDQKKYHENTINSSIILEGSDKERKMLKYISVGLGTILIGLIIYLFKK